MMIMPSVFCLHGAMRLCCACHFDSIHHMSAGSNAASSSHQAWLVLQCIVLPKVFDCSPSVSCGYRVDIVYELNTGQVFILAYILDPSRPCDILISSDAGSAMDVLGNPSQAASYFLRYTPRPASVDKGGLAMNAILASALAASAAMSTLAGLTHPYMPAGDSSLTMTLSGHESGSEGWLGRKIEWCDAGNESKPCVHPGGESGAMLALAGVNGPCLPASMSPVLSMPL